MRITRLAGQGFRNLAPFDVDLDAPFVVVHGRNAQGKTNLLEALWFVASLKPLHTSRPRELVGWGADGFDLGATSTHDGLSRDRRVRFEGGRRQLEVDGERCHTLEDWFGDLRAIVFTPSEGEVVAGAPEHRRRWLDRAVFTAQPAHLELVRAFQRVLSNKAAELRTGQADRITLDVLDEQLATLGARLTARRAALLDELGPHVRAMVQALTGAPSDVALTLRTAAAGEDEASRRAALHEALARARGAELRRGRALVGPQGDDVLVRLSERVARRHASRGQVRTLVLALKLAELVAARARGLVPVFLLDDLSSELDRARTGRLVGLLDELGAQVFATTTDPSHVLSGGPAASMLRIEDGTIFSD